MPYFYNTISIIELKSNESIANANYISMNQIRAILVYGTISFHLLQQLDHFNNYS